MKQAKANIRDAKRTVSYRYLPQILNTEANRKLVEDFGQVAAQVLEIAEKSKKPLSCICCPRRRFNCHCCFKPIFGETK